LYLSFPNIKIDLNKPSSKYLQKFKTIGVVMAITLFNSENGVQPSGIQSQTYDRKDVLIEDTWNIADLYASESEWSQVKEKLVADFEKILPYKDKLSNSSTQLLNCLKLNSSIQKEFGRLYSYASMLSDQDTRDAKAQALKEEMTQLSTDFTSRTSFIEPEILAMDKTLIEKFIAENPELKVYEFYLNDLQRRKKYMLSAKEEKILAESGLMSNSPYSIFSIFCNAELPYPEAKLSNGKTVLINQAGYSRYRTLPNRADREIIFQEFWGTMKKFRQTLGAQLYAAIKRDLFYVRTRGYKSCLEYALDANNIPISVYHTLIDNVNANLKSFHRYLNLRKTMLGVEQLKYSDLYASVVKGIDLKYSTSEAKEAIINALAPLGSEYVKIIIEGFNKRWIDMYPTTGKRSGAYSNGSVYDVHPYILMNYNGQYDAVSTLAHELGHALHSYFSNKNQPFPTADYPIFVAEVASTFNEALLINEQLKQIDQDEIRLSLLMNQLDGIKGTVFRQAQFAEFELKIHEMAERNEPLTGDSLTKLYGEIVRKYYGHEHGICEIEDLYTLEWAYIPHFYYNFYVYQYATSFTASIALVEKVLSGEKGAVDKFIEFISSGGSDYPINLLKTAGVDLTTTVPFMKTMKVMNQTMDEIEKILKKSK